MAKPSETEAQQKRLKVHVYFWNIVGSVEHVNVPKLEDALRREFRTSDTRFIEQQVALMQTEGRVKVQEKAKVWIKQPPDP